MLPQVLGQRTPYLRQVISSGFMLRAGRDENRTKLQANPHVHQQHIVLAMLKQYAAGERVDLLDDYDFQARTITETELSLFSTKGTLHHLGEVKKCLLVEQLVNLHAHVLTSTSAFLHTPSRATSSDWPLWVDRQLPTFWTVIEPQTLTAELPLAGIKSKTVEWVEKPHLQVVFCWGKSLPVTTNIADIWGKEKRKEYSVMINFWTTKSTIQTDLTRSK